MPEVWGISLLPPCGHRRRIQLSHPPHACTETGNAPWPKKRKDDRKHRHTHFYRKTEDKSRNTYAYISKTGKLSKNTDTRISRNSTNVTKHRIVCRYSQLLGFRLCFLFFPPRTCAVSDRFCSCYFVCSSVFLHKVILRCSGTRGSEKSGYNVRLINIIKHVDASAWQYFHFEAAQRLDRHVILPAKRDKVTVNHSIERRNMLYWSFSRHKTLHTLHL